MPEDENARIACKVVGPLATNCYILSCAETRKAIIIDPGGDPDLIKEFVSHTRLEPESIVCTHGHSDHIAAAADLKREYCVDFVIHEDDKKIVKQSVKEALLWGMGRIDEPAVDRVLIPGKSIAFGSVSGTVIHTPGHTPGGVSLLFGGFVIVGDTLFNRGIGRTDLLGGDLMTLLESIRNKLLTLPEETIVYCGHGPKTTIGEEKRENPFIAGMF